jgi:hypothetical protein
MLQEQDLTFEEEKKELIKNYNCQLSFGSLDQLSLCTIFKFLTFKEVLTTISLINK